MKLCQRIQIVDALGHQFYKLTDSDLSGKNQKGDIAIMSTKKEEAKSKFEEWLETQDESTKTLIQERFEVLESTVKATRQERDTFKGELKDLAKKIDENSDAGKAVSELQTRLAQAEKKSNFIEQAVKQGVKRPSAAYAIANTENLFKEDGSPDFEKIKESVPELFTIINTNNNAGSGSKTALPGKSVNDRIREATNKQTK